MQSIKIKNIKTLLLLALLTIVGLSTVLTSCDDDDVVNDELALLSYGPMPVPRGGELRFVGENLDKVNSIVLPPEIDIPKSEFTEHTDKSIKLIVPQEAMPGSVELVSTDKTITAKTPIGYSEPISIESFTPAKIKPGATLTIKGDYLNLIGEVIFTDRVAVDSADFKSQSRKELTLVVPAEAQTGKIAISDAAEDPAIVYSEAELEVVVSTFGKATPNPVKPGTDLTITGTDLDLVTSITFSGDVSVTEFAEDKGATITVKVPMNAQDGKIDLTMASGVVVTSASDVTMVKPTVTLAPTTLKNGETLTITGTDLDLITGVTFATEVAGEIVEGGTATQIQVVVPDAVVSGEVIFTTTSSTTVSGGSITIVAATVTSVDPATTKPNADITINGTDLDVVSSVMFAGDVEGTIVDQSATSIIVTVPVSAESGDITLVMINGETVSFSSIEIEQPDFCFIPILPEMVIDAGDIFVAEILNENMLTDVQVNGVTTQYIVEGTTLHALIPTSAIGLAELKLVSSNGEITYEIDVVGAGIVETVLYDVPLEIVGWGGAELPYIVEVPLPAFAKIRIRVSQANSELQVMDGYWGMGPNWAISDDAKKNVIKFSAEELSATGYVDVDFSVFHDENDNPWWDGKIMFNADGVTVSSVSLIVDYSAPTPIWEGSVDVIGWGTSFTDLTWGGYDFSGLSVGQMIYVYYTAAATATMRIGNGSWAAFPSTIAIAEASGDTSGEGNITIAAGSSSISFMLTAEDIQSIQNEGGLGAYGGDFTVTKVAIK